MSAISEAAFYLGSIYVNDLTLSESVSGYRASGRAFRARAVDILRLETRNAAGEMVPLGSLVDLRKSMPHHGCSLQPLPGRGTQRQPAPDTARVRPSKPWRRWPTKPCQPVTVTSGPRPRFRNSLRETAPSSSFRFVCFCVPCAGGAIRKLGPPLGDHSYRSAVVFCFL